MKARTETTGEKLLPGTAPLSGVKVLEIAGQGPAPFAAMMLGELGAEVVRVDRPVSDDLFSRNPAGNLLNRGKRSVIIDLKSTRGVACFLDLASQADVVLEGLRPGTVERLGIGPVTCMERNPALVYGRVTGYGQDGPLARAAGHDINYIAITGMLHAIGENGRPPQIPLNVGGDMGGGGLYLVVGILAALREAERDGMGQVVDAAIVDGAAHLLASVHSMIAMGDWIDDRSSNVFDGGAPYYGVYETSDRRFMAVGAVESKFYANLLSTLGLDEDPELQDSREFWPSTRARIAGAFLSRSQKEWTETFLDVEACVSPVVSLLEAAQHPHMAARRSLRRVEGILQAAPAPRMRTTEDKVAANPPPLPGSDSVQVLADWGIADIDGLLAEGAVLVNQ